MKKPSQTVPHYRGSHWLKARLPHSTETWQLSKEHSAAADGADFSDSNQALLDTVKNTSWRWPDRPIFFFSDLHADTDAFLASLVASGGIEKTGPSDQQFTLTHSGRKARFIIGGDCFDKGPSNLRLLRSLHRLLTSGAQLHLLAGNHDIRIKLGIASIHERRELMNEHFFLRMGTKAIPLLKEIQQEYLQSKKALKHIPDEKICRRKLFPSSEWYDVFPLMMQKHLPAKVIEQEIKKLRKKSQQFEHQLAQVDMNLRMAYAATLQWQALFLHEQGEFFWYYRRLRLMRREGSFLFVHAGIDDQVAKIIRQQGIKCLNRLFRQQFRQANCDFYYGHIANTLRTKYRDTDKPMSRIASEQLHAAGIHAIVHGHKNMRFGQRIALRQGIVNFECDASVDRNTRVKEKIGLMHAAAVTLIQPGGYVLGISSDYPFIKVFDPRLYS